MNKYKGCELWIDYFDLQFWPNNKTFEEVCMDVSVSDEVHKVLRYKEKIHSRDMYLSSDEYEEVEKTQLVNLLIGHIDTGTTIIEEAYMTEIQLRRIVDRTALEAGEQQSDGDERMVKDGDNISKFSKEAITLGDDARGWCLRDKPHSTDHSKKSSCMIST